MSLNGFPDNIDISPSNWKDLKLSKDFTTPRAGIEVNVDGFKLVREGYLRMIKWLREEQGAFENPPAQFTSPSESIYNLYIDMRTLDVGKNDISASLQSRKSNVHFFEKMDFLTFQLVRNEGFITDAMLIDFPFLKVPDDLKQQKAIQIAMLASLLFQVYIVIKEAADVVASFLDPLHIAAAIAQTINLALFLGLTIIAILETAINIQELFFPFIRYYKCISDYNLMLAACQREGYTFTSDFMVNEMYGMHTIGRPDPVNESIGDKFENFFQNTYFNKGYPSAIDSGAENAGALFNFYLDNFDTELFVFEGNVRLERSSFFSNNATVNVKPTMSEQDGKDDRYTFNFDQVWGRKYFRWANDENDYHSKEINAGSIRFEAITTQINTINADLVNLQGLKEYTAPFALVKRKNDYTGVEQFAINVLDVIEDYVGDLYTLLQQQNGSNLTSLISKRLGVGMFERDYWTVTRKVWGVPALENNRIVLKQPENYLEILSQESINSNFNTGLYVKNNFYKVKQITVPFTDDNFISLQMNNRVNYEGIDDPIKVLKVDFYPYQYEATLIVELPDDGAFNTQITIL